MHVRKRFFILFFLPFIIQPAAALDLPTKCIWDQQLPNLRIQRLSLKANTIEEAWMGLSSKHLLRSVLVVTPNIVNPAREFVIDVTGTTVRDVFEIFTSTYPELTMHQDETYGVTWFHPKDFAYSSILDERIEVPKDQMGLLMNFCILDPITNALHIPLGSPRGGGAWNTFNNPVDIPAGTYTVRDILNLCAVEACSKSFQIMIIDKNHLPPLPPGAVLNPKLNWEESELYQAAPVNLGPDTGQPEGLTNYWETYCCPSMCDPPALDDVIKALSSSDPVTSWAARNIYEIFTMQTDFQIIRKGEAALKNAAPSTESLRFAIAMCRAHVQVDFATHKCAFDFLKRCADSGFLSKDKGPLALLGALEIYRLRGGKEPLDRLLQSLPDQMLLDEVTSSDLWRATRQISRRGFDWKADEETGRKIRNWLLGPGATQKELDEPISTELQFIPR